MLVAVLAMVLFVGAIPARAAQVPVATPAQKAEAIAKPSVVFIVTKWHGYVMNGPLAILLSSNGTSAPGFTVTTTCSGFIANPTGYVVTAGHCVDDQTMQYGGKGLIIRAAVAEAIRQGYFTPSEASGLLKEGYSNWTVEGTEKGSPPDRTVGVFPTKAASTITVANPIQANVVDFTSFTKGDVALLKVESKNPMPALQLAPEGTANGVAVVAAGFPGSVLDTVDPNTSEPSFKDGTVSGSRTVAGVPFTEISAATSSGMSGGPVVDMQGRAIGTVSWSPGAETQPFNFITATSAMRQMLASHSVDNRLSVTDTTYRAGLTSYFAGKYHDAAKKFDQVLALEPDHAQAQEYKRLAVTNYPNEKSSGSSLGLVLGIVGGVIVLLLAGGATFFFVRRRRARPPVPPAPSGAWARGDVATEPVVTPSAPAATPSTEVPTAVAVGSTEVHTTGGFCPDCGAPHEVDAHFCAECGHRFPVPVPHRNGSSVS